LGVVVIYINEQFLKFWFVVVVVVFVVVIIVVVVVAVVVVWVLKNFKQHKVSGDDDTLSRDRMSCRSVVSPLSITEVLHSSKSLTYKYVLQHTEIILMDRNGPVHTLMRPEGGRKNIVSEFQNSLGKYT